MFSESIPMKNKFYYIKIKSRIYLVTAYKKTDKENLTADDKKVLKKLAKTLKDMED